MTRVNELLIGAEVGNPHEDIEFLLRAIEDLQRELRAALLEAETQRQLAALAEKRWSGLLDAWNHYVATLAGNR